MLTKVHIVKVMVFPVAVYACQSWTIKKAEHQRTDAFELWCWRRLLRVLDCKEIKPVNPKGNQSCIFIGRTDAEAEAPILWPPDAKGVRFLLTRVCIQNLLLFGLYVSSGWWRDDFLIRNTDTLRHRHHILNFAESFENQLKASLPFSSQYFDMCPLRARIFSHIYKTYSRNLTTM